MYKFKIKGFDNKFHFYTASLQTKEEVKSEIEIIKCFDFCTHIEIYDIKHNKLILEIKNEPAIFQEQNNS